MRIGGGAYWAGRAVAHPLFCPHFAAPKYKQEGWLSPTERASAG